MSPGFHIADKHIGPGSPVFIIAEMSANHLQDLENAVKIIEAAKEAGTDAIKLQTFTPDTITVDCDNEYFQINQGTPWDGKTLYELYQEVHMPWEWQPKLKKIAEDLGLICFSTPFDKTAVDFLEEIAVPAYKIASCEITDLPLIEYIASKDKPVIISTGIATLNEIEEALHTCRAAGNDQTALLKCTSSYPASLEEVNLRTIPDMIKKFKVIVGLSDHTLGITSAVTATAVGASIIEKHLTLDRSLGGPDAMFSAEPREFAQMVNSVRETEKALGNASYDLTDEMRKSRKFSRSLFAVVDIKAGGTFTKDNIRSIRPSDGLGPKYIKDILGKKAAKHIEKGTPLSWELIT